ncbi:MAG: CPBP family intramembrane metalloprotease [Lachnospiraceae bacterium]|nr:CPBP family intramembrane metalloprotease [Lachnospiraceae bacterium]
MNEKRVNRTGWLYLVIIELFILANIVRLLLGERGEMNIFPDILLSQGMIILPVIIYCIITRTGLKDLFSFRVVRIPTLFLTVLYIIMWYPLIAACNAFTMLFTENTAMEMSQSFEGVNPFLIWLIVGVAGPLMEELAFRGVILSGLKKSGRILASVVLQALMFGVLHLNLNQMSYAIVLGIAFGLAVSATESVWCGFVGHMLINSVSVIAMQVMSRLPGDLMEESMGAFSDPVAMGQIASVIPVLFLAGLVSAGLSMFLLKAMSSIEGRGEIFGRMPAGRKFEGAKIRVFTLPAVLGLLLGVVFIAIQLLIRF